MKKIAIIVAIAVLVIILSYLLITRVLNKPQGTTPQDTKKEIMSGTLYDISQQSGNQICTWTKQEEGANINGTVYISEGKFAMDTTIKSENTATTMHTLGDGKTVYMWADSTDIPGTTMEYSRLQNAPEGTAPNALIYSKMDYSCSAWTPEEAVFTLPTNIEFQ